MKLPFKTNFEGEFFYLTFSTNKKMRCAVNYLPGFCR